MGIRKFDLVAQNQYLRLDSLKLPFLWQENMIMSLIYIYELSVFVINKLYIKVASP